MFGLYTLGVAIVTAAQIISQFGLDNGVVRYVAAYRAQGDTHRVRGTILQALGLTVALSLVVAVAIFFGAGLISDVLNKPDLEPVVRAFAFAVPFFALMSIICWATQGFQTVAYATYTQQILRPLIYLSARDRGLLRGRQPRRCRFRLRGLDGPWGAHRALLLVASSFPTIFDRRVAAKFETKALFNVSVPMSITTGRAVRSTPGQPSWCSASSSHTGPPSAIFGTAARTATLSHDRALRFLGIFSPMISSFYSRGEMAGSGPPL